MKGTVKFYNNKNAYGFINGDDGKEYFVHQTGLNEGVSLNEGDTVEFEVEEGTRGPKAVNVRKGSSKPTNEEPEQEAAEEDEEAAEEDEEASEESSEE